MITLSEYVGPHGQSPDWTQECIDSAEELLLWVNALAAYLESQGVVLPTNPATGSRISGKTFGGFRPQSCPQGAPSSSHKTGKGIDLYDPHNGIDNAITDARLAKFSLYREHPDSTKGWCHLTTRAPGSGRRTFLP